MDAVSIIVRVGDNWRYVTISEAEYPATIGILLKQNYTDFDKIVELLDHGNITTLAETIPDTVFTGTPSLTIAAVHNDDTDFDVADYNFISSMDRAGNRSWVMTRHGIPGFYNI